MTEKWQQSAETKRNKRIWFTAPRDTTTNKWRFVLRLRVRFPFLQVTLRRSSRHRAYFESACAQMSWIWLWHIIKGAMSSRLNHIVITLETNCVYLLSLNRSFQAMKSCDAHSLQIYVPSVLTCSFFAHARAPILINFNTHLIAHRVLVYADYCNSTPNAMFAAFDAVVAALRRAYASVCVSLFIISGPLYLIVRFKRISFDP